MYSVLITAATLCVSLLFNPIDGTGADHSGAPGHIWKQIIAEAEGLGLPTKF